MLRWATWHLCLSIRWRCLPAFNASAQVRMRTRHAIRRSFGDLRCIHSSAVGIAIGRLGLTGMAIEIVRISLLDSKSDSVSPSPIHSPFFAGTGAAAAGFSSTFLLTPLVDATGSFIFAAADASEFLELSPFIV